MKGRHGPVIEVPKPSRHHILLTFAEPLTECHYGLNVMEGVQQEDP